MVDTEIAEIVTSGNIAVLQLRARERGETCLFVKANGEMEDTMLHLAAYFDFEGKITEYLLNQGLDPNIRNKNGITPLMYAIERNNTKTAKLFIKAKNLNVNEKDTHNKTALHHMLLYRRFDMIEFFLAERKEKINMEIRDNKGRNIIFLACDTHEPNSEILTKLIKRGCDVNSRDDKQRTILMTAVMNKYKKVFNYLLKNKADIDALDCDNESVVHKAVRLDDKNYLEELLFKSPDLTIRGGDEMLTPLMLAIEINNPVFAEMLSKPKYDKEIINRKGLKASQLLMKRSSFDLTKIKI